MFYRSDNRAPDQMRPVNILPNFITTAEGSALIELGNTRVICTASMKRLFRNLCAIAARAGFQSEYAMLPRSPSDSHCARGQQRPAQGRTHEIQRLIGRSLRAVTDLERLGERTIWIDCDVIQADGGAHRVHHWRFCGSWLGAGKVGGGWDADVGSAPRFCGGGQRGDGGWRNSA